MVSEFLYSLFSVIIISLIAFIGVLTLWMKHDTLKACIIYFVGFSAGALIGDVFMHLLPEAAEDGFGLKIGLYVITGILFSFIVEKIIRWHHCHNVDYHKHHEKIKPVAYMNLIGDGVHNFIDGIIIAASYLISVPIGLATTLAVVFHEIPQELGDFGVLLHGGMKKLKALFFNFLSGMAAIFGVLIFWLVQSESLLDFLVPFAAGHFIYIAGSDLIPELHEEEDTKKNLYQLGIFVLGICVMALLLLLE